MTDSVGLGKKQERFGFIGGSDVSRIMSGDWHSLWEEKTRRAEPEDLSDNLAVQIGTLTELFRFSHHFVQMSRYCPCSQCIIERLLTCGICRDLYQASFDL